MFRFTNCATTFVKDTSVVWRVKCPLTWWLMNVTPNQEMDWVTITTTHQVTDPVVLEVQEWVVEMVVPVTVADEVDLLILDTILIRLRHPITRYAHSYTINFSFSLYFFLSDFFSLSHSSICAWISIAFFIAFLTCHLLLFCMHVLIFSPFTNTFIHLLLPSFSPINRFSLNFLLSSHFFLSHFFLSLFPLSTISTKEISSLCLMMFIHESFFLSSHLILSKKCT